MLQDCSYIEDEIQAHHNETRMSLLWSSKARKTYCYKNYAPTELKVNSTNMYTISGETKFLYHQDHFMYSATEERNSYSCRCICIRAPEERHSCSPACCLHQSPPRRSDIHVAADVFVSELQRSDIVVAPHVICIRVRRGGAIFL